MICQKSQSNWKWDVNTERSGSALLLTSSTVLSLGGKMRIQSLEGWALCAVMIRVPVSCCKSQAHATQKYCQWLKTLCPRKEIWFFRSLSGVPPCYCHANLRDRFSYCLWDRDSPQLRIRERRENPLQATTACQTGLATLQELKVKMGPCSYKDRDLQKWSVSSSAKEKIESGFSSFKFPLFPKLCFKKYSQGVLEPALSRYRRETEGLRSCSNKIFWGKV